MGRPRPVFEDGVWRDPVWGFDLALAPGAPVDTWVAFAQEERRHWEALEIFYRGIADQLEAE